MTTITKIFQTSSFSHTITVSSETPQEAIETLKKVEDEDEIRRVQPKRESLMRMDA